MTTTHPYKQVIYFLINEGPNAVEDKFYTAALPKVGWHSFRRYAQEHQCGVATQEEVRADCTHPFYFSIRHPWTRLQAAYAYHQGQGISLPAQLGHVGWEQFVDAVLGGAMDHHWAPQIEGLARQPDRVFRFEDVKYWWPACTGDSLPHLNQVSYPKPEGEYRKQEVMEMYWLDFQAWRNAE
jgi:hypothetical protein